MEYQQGQVYYTTYSYRELARMCLREHYTPAVAQSLDVFEQKVREEIGGGGRQHLQRSPRLPRRWASTTN